MLPKGFLKILVQILLLLFTTLESDYAISLRLTNTATQHDVKGEVTFKQH